MAQFPATDEDEALGPYSAVRATDRPAARPQARPTLSGASAPLAAGSSLSILSHVSSFTAHELVNPLSGLQTALSVLANTQLDDRSGRLVNHCQQLVRKMLDTATDLRTLGGAHQPALEEVRLSALIEGIFRSLVPPDGYRVLLALDGEGRPATIQANGRLLSLALRNLVRNALDALDGGGALGATVDRRDDFTCITVWDEGPGIAPECRASLFDHPFTTKSCGSGLGLLLVKAIAERVHHGRVSYAPNHPHGASFQLELPGAP